MRAAIFAVALLGHSCDGPCKTSVPLQPNLMKALLLVVVLLAAFAADVAAKRGDTCRTYSTQAGPVYKASGMPLLAYQLELILLLSPAPHKEKFICDPRPAGHPGKLAVIDRWACAGYCWKRHFEDSPVIVVQGNVRKAGECGSVVPGVGPRPPSILV